MIRSFLSCCFVVLLLLATAGCTAHHSFRSAEQLLQQGEYDEAVVRYQEALEKNPTSLEYRERLQQAKAKAALVHLNKGRDLRQNGQLMPAIAELQQAIILEPTFEVAARELQEIQQEIEIDRVIAEAEMFFQEQRLQQATNNLERVLKVDPANLRAKELLSKIRAQRVTVIDGFELDVASDKPLTLKFKETKVKDVFNILTQLSGINFIFDEDLKDQKISLFIEKASFAQALDLLLNMNTLGKKVLNSKTIIIYPKNKDKEKQYQDQIIQTFYLSNIDAKKAVNLLRTMLQLRKIYVHEELNALVIRDTPEVIKLCQQVLEAADRSDAEVVFDLELVEVSHNDTLNVGPTLSSYATSLGLAQNGTIVSQTLSAGTATTNLVHSLNGLDVFYTLPTVTYNFQKSLTDSEILANPKIRVKNRDKAKVHVGTREPVITVTTTNETRSDNIQYVDVGVKLDVEPTVQLDDTIVTKLSLEVSSVSDRRTTNNGSVALTITTTNATSALTLKDGEQTIIGGLIRDDYSKTKTTFPILGHLPLIGDLISGHNRTKNKREILLSITPHIIKSVDLPRADVASIWSGGEEDMKAGPTFGAFVETFEPDSQKMRNPVVPGQQPPAPIRPEGMAPSPPTTDDTVPGNGVGAPPEAPAPIAPAVEEKAAEPSAAVPTEKSPPSAEENLMAYLPIDTVRGEYGGELIFRTPPTLKVGETAAFAVEVSSVNALSSAPLILHFDTRHLEFIRAEEGGFLKQAGQTSVFTSNLDQQNGDLMIGYKQGAEGSGASGNGILYRVFFLAKETGTALVGLKNINFQDVDGNRFNIPPTDLTVEIK